MDRTSPTHPVEPHVAHHAVMAGHWQDTKSPEYRTYQRLYQRTRYQTERRREEKRLYYLKVKDKLAAAREYKRASRDLLRVLV